MSPVTPECARAVQATNVPTDQPVFRVGYAEVDITPDNPLPMWGYGVRHDMLSVGVRDRLMAGCIVMQAGANTLAIVGLDLGRSLGEPHFSHIRERVRSDCGVSHVMICGSHTHHGPVLELRGEAGQGLGKFDAAVAYVALLEQRIVEVIDAAAGELREAKIGWGSINANRNRNRHSKHTSKPCDTELAVVRLDDAGGNPLALMVNFAAHPVLLHPADLRWSADYPGTLKRTVAATFGAPCVFLQGAAGDLSVRFNEDDSSPTGGTDLRQLEVDMRERDLFATMHQNQSDNTSAIADPLREFHRSERHMQSFGESLAEDVLAVARGIETVVPPVASIAGNYECLPFAARVDFRDPQLVALYEAAFFPELAQSYAADHSDNIVRPALTTVVINNQLALVGGSGEFFCHHAIRLKGDINRIKTLFVGYCNGHNMYFPTREGVAEGGYGADPQYSWIEVGGGERLIDKALAHIREMLGERDADRFDKNGSP